MKNKRLFLVLGLSGAICAIIAVVIAYTFQDYCGYCDKKAFIFPQADTQQRLG